MGLPQGKLLLLLSHLAFLLVASSAELPPASAPSYHHHHHLYPFHKPHHKHLPLPYPHPHSPVPAPSYPPVKPPVHPPVKPPTKPPVYPPVKPPVHPPVKPPTKPPVLPPVKPPVQPPVKPPVYPPVKPPVQPPVKPPMKPPVYPPIKPPTYPPVKTPPTLSVEGVVYCKNCSFLGIDTLLGAKPLPGATVVLKCKNKLPEKAVTDKNGYFLLKAAKSISSYKAIRYCRVKLLAAPAGASCSRATNLNGGIKGGFLKPEKTAGLFSVGPFAFGPPKHSCHY